ncbi:MAG: pilus assembly protein TadG-related protein, partial [Novosphingobium sp.]|nr:pilus assembly protein TadG-related protein [Novosphingobium sp.]
MISALLRCRSGNILPLSAMAIFAVAALIGGAVDMSRGWRVQTRLQAACDAGVLAGRRAVTANGFDTNAQVQAQNYFYANFDADRMDALNTAFVATSANKGGTIDGVATAQLPPLIMQLFGFGGFQLRTTCTATMGVGNSDIMMVLDTTGSMNFQLSGSTQTRIQALRASMKSFYDTLATATSGSNARIRFGFVPYSSSVNVGRLIRNLNPDYLVDNWTIQSRQAVYRTVQTLTGYGAPTAAPGTSTTSNPTYTGWTDHVATTYPLSSSCVAARPADTAWTNSGAATSVSTTTINGSGQQITTTVTTQAQTMIDYECNWQVLFFKLQRRTGSVSTNTGDSGASVSSTWRGCIEERATVRSDTYSWSALAGFTPSGARDLDIDTPPDGSTSSKWAPMWPEVAYIRTQTINGTVYMNTALPSPTGQQAPSFCPTPAQLLTSMSRAAYFAYADALVPEGATYHDIGMVWGARLFSPDGMWSSNVREAPGNGGEAARHMIFMTDGEMAPSYSIQSAWGIEYHDRRVTDDGVNKDTERHNARFLALCEAVKAKGIRVWVIAFAQGMTSQLSA